MINSIAVHEVPDWMAPVMPAKPMRFHRSRRIQKKYLKRYGYQPSRRAEFYSLMGVMYATKSGIKKLTAVCGT